eukprot:768488-Hanusia_phi.AAC.4
MIFSVIGAQVEPSCTGEAARDVRAQGGPAWRQAGGGQAGSPGHEALTVVEPPSSRAATSRLCQASKGPPRSTSSLPAFSGSLVLCRSRFCTSGQTRQGEGQQQQPRGSEGEAS